MNGVLTPFTFQREHLISVARGDSRPFTPEEVAWNKYLGRKNVEKKYGSILYIQYKLDDDPFYTQVGKANLNKIMYDVITEIHFE
jgi:uncharacterized protein YifE (UPF0438 family)